MRLLLVAALLPLPALAEKVAWECAFTRSCSEESCGPTDLSYRFQLDTDRGVGRMIADGQAYEGTAARSEDGISHWFFFNAAGAEVVSITDAGDVSYSGHMVGDGQLLTYRLSGTCRRGG